jgi:hypothetical protein
MSASVGISAGIVPYFGSLMRSLGLLIPSATFRTSDRNQDASAAALARKPDKPNCQPIQRSKMSRDRSADHQYKRDIAQQESNPISTIPEIKAVIVFCYSAINLIR